MLQRFGKLKNNLYLCSVQKKNNNSKTKKKIMKNKLETLVRSYALAPIDETLDAETIAKANRHKEICAELVKLSDEHKVPMSFLVYFAVNKTAHKEAEFNKGYSKFDRDKALRIIEMAREFAAYHGMNKPNDKAYHAMTAFYERKSQSLDDFKAALAKMKPNKNYATARSICQLMGM
jgi:hypothetical protein